MMMDLNELFIPEIANIIQGYGDHIKLKQIERMDRLVYRYNQFLNNDMHDYEKLIIKNIDDDIYYLMIDLMVNNADTVKERQRNRKDSMVRVFKLHATLSKYQKIVNLQSKRSDPVKQKQKQCKDRMVRLFKLHVTLGRYPKIANS